MTFTVVGTIKTTIFILDTASTNNTTGISSSCSSPARGICNATTAHWSSNDGLGKRHEDGHLQIILNTDNNPFLRIPSLWQTFKNKTS